MQLEVVISIGSSPIYPTSRQESTFSIFHSTYMNIFGMTNRKDYLKARITKCMVLLSEILIGRGSQLIWHYLEEL